MASDGADVPVDVAAGDVDSGWSQAEFEALVRAGESSPRVAGARSWWAALDDHAVTLRTTVVHARSTSAPGVRETRISVGAALLGMRLFVAAHGARPYLTLLPDPARPEVLALLRRAAGRAARPVEGELSALVGPIPGANGRGTLPALRYALRRAAAAEGAWLRTATGREELAALGVPARVRGAVPETPLYAVLGGDGDVPVAQLRVGQALHRVLLTAARLRLPGRLLAGPTELLVSDGRRLDVRGPRPQVLVGLG